MVSNDNMIFIGDLDKVEVFQALYDRANPQGMGFLHYVPGPITREEAQSTLSFSPYVDYHRGRVMKVSLEHDYLNPFLYDRDNGPGAAAQAIATLR